MKDNASRSMIITGIICFLVGGVVGYMARGKMKLSSKEFERQLGRLDAKETAEVIKTLEQAWGISSTPPRIVPASESGKGTE